MVQLIDGCIFLTEEYARSKGSKLQQFPDRMGYECFVNHIHFRVGRGRRALEEVFDYASALRKALMALGEVRFEVIISVADGDSVVRFHKCRQGESWLSEDLERYKHEAILSVTV